MTILHHLFTFLSIYVDTGLGREGYSNIGQGRIDEILSLGVALRAKADMILVTDNSELAGQFRELRRSASFRVTRTVEVARLNDAGELVPACGLHLMEVTY